MRRVIIAISIILALSGGIGAYFLTRTSPIEAVESKPAVEPITISELHRLVNLEREKVGIAPLVLDEQLNASAKLKADELVIEGWDSTPHVSNSGKHGYEYIPKGISCLGGENLLAYQPSTASAVAWWMGSTPHKDAMLRADSTRVGYAVVGDYVVQHLC